MTTNRICEFRKIHKITQTQLANEIGVSKNAIYDLETGNYSPRLETAIKLSERLGVKIDVLFEIDYDYDNVRAKAAFEYLAHHN